MPKAQTKNSNVKKPRSSRPKRKTGPPIRYGREASKTNPIDEPDASDNSQNSHSENGSDDNSGTLEARLLALEAQLRHQGDNRRTTQASVEHQVGRRVGRRSRSMNRRPKHSRHRRKRRHERSTDEDDDDNSRRGRQRRHRRPKKHLRYTADESRRLRKRRRRERKRKATPTSDSSLPSSSSEYDSECDSDSESSDSESLSDEHDRPLTSFGTLVGGNISQKLKKKIVTHKFVDLHLLLPNHDVDNTESYTMSMPRGKKPSVKFEKPQPTPITNYYQWSEAWETYMAVYTSYKPHQGEIRAMLTYARDLRNMARSNYNWLGYDRHFRLDREQSHCNWAVVRHDLHLIYKNNDSFRKSDRGITGINTSTHLTTSTGHAVPKGYCIKFHTRGQRCDQGNSCQYMHKCPTCQARHPIYETCTSYRNKFQDTDSNRTKPNTFNGNQIPVLQGNSYTHRTNQKQIKRN